MQVILPLRLTHTLSVQISVDHGATSRHKLESEATHRHSISVYEMDAEVGKVGCYFRHADAPSDE